MFHSRTKRLLILLLITVFAGTKVSAQTTAAVVTNTSDPLSEHENNPYSKYGIGELWNGNNTVLMGMGNVTSAFENPYEVNSDNPASYAFLKRTTFEVGAMASTRVVSAQGESYTTGTVSLAYLDMGIPINKNTGMCIGFRPYTHTYYSLLDTITSPIGQTERNYNGFGALSYAYVGAATKVDGVSVGFNFGYMFGTLQNASAVVPIDTNVINRAYTTEYTTYDRIGGLYGKLGIMYETKIDSTYTLRVGGTFTAIQSLLERVSAFQIATYNFGDTIVNDTVSNPGEQRGKLRLPMSYSIGVMFAKDNKWDLGIDYTATQWSGFRSTPDSNLENGVGTSSYKFSVGGEYTPNINDIRNYWSRVTYRFGIYYGKDYLDLNGVALPTYGITAGTSFPFKRTTSELHLALDIGRLGTYENNLIQETYVRFTLGISFNDRWFIPRKYD